MTSDMALLSPREFTVTEYHRMDEVGLFRADERVELLDGLIVTMSPIAPRHWQRHASITGYLYEAVGKSALVVPQGSFPLGDKSEPQPDIAVLARLAYDERSQAPTPDEIFAFIELADASLAKDTGPKLRLYARFGIADYLVVDLDANVVLHHAEPHELAYRRCDRLQYGDAFQFSRLPGLTLRTNAFLKATEGG